MAELVQCSNASSVGGRVSRNSGKSALQCKLVTCCGMCNFPCTCHGCKQSMCSKTNFRELSGLIQSFSPPLAVPLMCGFERCQGGKLYSARLYKGGAEYRNRAVFCMCYCLPQYIKVGIQST